MKFSEMPYTRPNVAQTVERYREMAQRAAAAASGKELVDLFRLHTQLDDGFATAYRLAQIRHTLDTRDEFYDAENDFFDQASPEVGTAQLAFYRAVIRIVTGVTVPIHIIAVEKNEPFATGVWQLTGEVLDLAERINEAALERYKNCQHTGIWPTGYEDIRIIDSL